MRYAVWTLGADECRPPLGRGMVVAARFDWHDRAIDDTRVVAAKGRAVACSLVQFGRSALALYMPPLPDATHGQDMAKARSRFALRRPDEQPFGNTVHGAILNEIEKAGSAVAVGSSLPFRPLEIGLIVFLGRGSQTEPLGACAPRREEQHLIMTDRSAPSIRRQLAWLRSAPLSVRKLVSRDERQLQLKNRIADPGTTTHCVQCRWRYIDIGSSRLMSI